VETQRAQWSRQTNEKQNESISEYCGANPAPKKTAPCMKSKALREKERHVHRIGRRNEKTPDIVKHRVAQIAVWITHWTDPAVA